MAPPSEARFRRALARLDADAAAAFLAALLSARGDETSVTDGVVRAERAGRQRTFVVAGGDGDVAPDEPSVLVDTGRRRARRAVTDEAAGTYLGPVSLYRMLLYAIDRPEAERIAADHLGLEFDAGESSWLSGRLPAGAPAVEPVTVGVVALVVVFATVAGAVAFVDAGGLGGSESTADAGSPSSVGPATNGSSGPTGAAVSVAREPAGPPGVADGRLEDVEALATAHRNVTEGRSYSLLIRGQGRLHPIRHRPSLATFFGQPPPWYALRQRISVERPTVYRSRVTGIRADGPNRQESVVYDDYADGETVYRRYGGENPTARFGKLPMNPGLISEATGSYVARYLDTPNTTVSRERGIYRLVATGAPREFDVPVETYRAEAWVSPEGFVYRLEATYTVSEADVRQNATTATNATGTESDATQPQNHTFVFSYDRIDTTEADRPDWYEPARVATTPAEHPAGIQPGSDHAVLADALAESHSAIMRSNSYRWRLSHQHSLGGGIIDDRWTGSYQHAAVVRPTSYSFRVRGSYRTANGSRASVSQDVYADGRYRYRRRGTSASDGTILSEPVYDRVPLAVEPTDPFARIAERYVRRYLAVESVTLTVRENTSVPRYRVVATGRPTRLPGAENVTDYRAVAEIRQSGLVESLSVDYLRTEAGSTTGVEFEFTFDDVGTTTVDRPSWYAEARQRTSLTSGNDAGNATSDRVTATAPS